MSVNQSEKHITMADIAARLQLSTGTVSRALNGSPQIKKETKARVEQTALELGFVINIDASYLRKKGLEIMPGGKKPVTITDIAEALRISTSTVSRSFGAKPDVSAVTRAKVLAKANEMGFILQEYAHRLRKK